MDVNEVQLYVIAGVAVVGVLADVAIDIYNGVKVKRLVNSINNKRNSLEGITYELNSCDEE